MMSFLGLTNYCRAWIPNYAEITHPLNCLIKPIPMTAKLEWTDTAESAFCKLKQVLVSSATLALPDYTKPFVQMVDCEGCFMTQQRGDKFRPVAYYSSKLDAVTCAMPHCVCAVVAASLAVEASAGIVLFHDTVLKVPHAVSALLLHTNMTFLSPATHLSCMAILLSQPHLRIERCTTLNPATLLPLMTVKKWPKCRKDLSNQPQTEGEVLFVDGSSRKSTDGTTLSGYAVATQTEMTYKLLISVVIIQLSKGLLINLCELQVSLWMLPFLYCPNTVQRHELWKRHIDYLYEKGSVETNPHTTK